MLSSRERTIASCWACGAGDVRVWRLATPPEMGRGGGASYLLERCAACGTAAVAAGGRNAEWPELYEVGTYGAGPTRLLPLIAVLRALVVRDRMRFLRGLPRGSRILEVGCGDGRFLAALASRGYEVRGIERARPRAAQARARGLAVEDVPVEEARVPDASQDVVVLWHVLEHLDDPGGTLALARDWLAPAGRLVLAAPNLASLQAQLGGDRWFHQDVPRHVTHFTVQGLVALVERSGFRVSRVRHLLLEHNVFGMWQTLLNRLTEQRDVVYGFLKRSGAYPTRATAVRDAAVLALAGPVLLLPAAGLEVTAGLLGRGGTIVVEASRL